MKYRDCLIEGYNTIFDDCVITTASCSFYAPYLFNMLFSLHKNFHNHPKVYVFNLGMSKTQITELAQIPWVKIENIPDFVPYWRLCYTWKPYVLQYCKERYILHLDAGLIVLKPLYLWFLSIKKLGYITFSQGQKLINITPPEYFEKIRLDINSVKRETVFSAGIFGYDKLSFAGGAVKESFSLAKEGWTLGFSKKELHRVTCSQDNIIRNCNLFRHDQTLINLTLRKYSNSHIFIRSEKFIPIYKPKKNDKIPYLWSARRNTRSLIFLWKPITNYSYIFFLNRIEFILSKIKYKFIKIFKRLRI